MGSLRDVSDFGCRLISKHGPRVDQKGTRGPRTRGVLTASRPSVPPRQTKRNPKQFISLSRYDYRSRLISQPGPREDHKSTRGPRTRGDPIKAVESSTSDSTARVHHVAFRRGTRPGPTLVLRDNIKIIRPGSCRTNMARDVGTQRWAWRWSPSSHGCRHTGLTCRNPGARIPSQAVLDSPPSLSLSYPSVVLRLVEP
ncbi:hypothetical protein BHM03_00027125 [Ensete ventricosum]|nr:hypothetical protein BHM03_00027125 [Ensete ventricosum]